jgi:hypothetical protein
MHIGITNMKVKISGYPPFIQCRIHDRAMQKKYGSRRHFMSDNQYTKFDRSLEKLEDVMQVIYNLTINRVINLFMPKQNISVRIDKYDTWGMNNTLAYIIVPMLKQLKENKQGAPHIDIKDVPFSLRPTPEEVKTAEEDYDVDPKFFDRWNWVLDEMIFAFESYIIDWEDQFYSGKHDMIMIPQDLNGNKVNEGDALMYGTEYGPNHTFKVDHKGMKVYTDRITRGTKLFGKYYANLWD